MFNNIPGFRSRKVWKMVVATTGYSLFALIATVIVLAIALGDKNSASSSSKPPTPSVQEQQNKLPPEKTEQQKKEELQKELEAKKLAQQKEMEEKLARQKEIELQNEALEEKKRQEEKEAFYKFNIEFERVMLIHSNIDAKLKATLKAIGTRSIDKVTASNSMIDCIERIPLVRGEYSQINIPKQLKPEHQKILALSLQQMITSLNFYEESLRYAVEGLNGDYSDSNLQRIRSNMSDNDYYMREAFGNYVTVRKEIESY